MSEDVVVGKVRGEQPRQYGRRPGMVCHSWDPGRGPYGWRDVENVCRNCGVRQRYLSDMTTRWYLAPLSEGGPEVWSTIRPPCRRRGAQ